MLPTFLDLGSVRCLYASRQLTPQRLIEETGKRIDAHPDKSIFIALASPDDLRRQIEALLARAPEPNSLPLWGIPFAVKDNINVVGLPTTAACPAFSYMPERDATCVERLKAAGAIVIGKTNLDQFATGLNGTRSPYGAPRCVFNSEYISGGSSSGSAVSVAAGLVTFALGTDTAGSGRVPASFNNIVGIKPTPGRVSTRGLVPACRSLDVITVFSGSVADGLEIRRLMEGKDREDPFSQLGALTPSPSAPRVGVLRAQDREFFGDTEAADLYAATVDQLSSLGATPVPFDYGPFREMAALLYSGPWVAERLAAIEEFYASHAADLDPSVRTIIEGAKAYTAVDAFRGLYRREELRRAAEETWTTVDMLLLPTAPTIYTVEAMRADPLVLNSHLGHYTNFANLLGLAAIAVPAGFRTTGLPFGVTFVGADGSDEAIAPLADAIHRLAGTGMGVAREAELPPLALKATDERTPFVVVGAHLTGMPLNGELQRLGAIFSRVAQTRPYYRLYALPNSQPPKPGLVRDRHSSDHGIEVEVWLLKPKAFAAFVSSIPQPLGVGRIELEDGSTPQGFLCETWALAEAEEITAYGGWRAFVKERLS